MAYPISAGIEISLDGSIWYKLTDHNRGEIQSTPEIIESQNRMANGKLRKYIVAKKYKISTDWTFVPTKTSETVDGNYSAGWLEAFYNTNAGVPVYVKIINSTTDSSSIPGTVPSDLTFKTSVAGSQVYTTFMTSFSTTLIKRTVVSDYVSMNIEFTEI